MPSHKDVELWPEWAQQLERKRHSEPTKAPNRHVPNPPGFGTKIEQSGKDRLLPQKKAWELAIAPLKQLPIKAFGMWMTGNTLQIFSIYMIFSLFKEPITAIINVGTTFSKLETETNGKRDRMLLVKLAYVFCHLLTLGMGMYKVDKMGLLPTTRSDWLAWESSRTTVERAIPFSLWDWASQS